MCVSTFNEQLTARSNIHIISKKCVYFIYKYNAIRVNNNACKQWYFLYTDSPSFNRSKGWKCRQDNANIPQ